MSWIEPVIGYASHYGLAVLRREQIPQFSRAARMDAGSNENDRAMRGALQSGADSFDFVGGVDDRRLQHPDRGGWNGLVQKYLAVILLFADVLDGELLESFTGFDGMGQPDFRGISLLVDSGRLQCPVRHSAAENGNGIGISLGIFADEPAAEVEKTGDDQTNQREQYHGPKAGAFLRLRR